LSSVIDILQVQEKLPDFRASQPKEDEIAFQYLSWGGAPVDWFVKQGVILGGIPLQNWMLLAIAIILLSVLISWWAHK
jgi:hypothetical protein